jgi:hypothetical protein
MAFPPAPASPASASGRPLATRHGCRHRRWFFRLRRCKRRLGRDVFDLGLTVFWTVVLVVDCGGVRVGFPFQLVPPIEHVLAFFGLRLA